MNQTLQDRRTLALAEKRAAEEKLREIEAELLQDQALIRKARVLVDGSWTAWLMCAGVTHAEAAKQTVEALGLPGNFTWEVQTRDQDDRADAIMRHRVTRRVVYDVVSLRGDE